MITYLTEKLITELEQQTENLLNKAVSEWQMLSPEKMLQQPAEGKWSAAQCLEHLNAYGRYYLTAIEKEISEQTAISQPPNTFRAGWLGNYFTRLMLPKEDGKVTKMSAPKEYSPNNKLNSDRVLAEFINQQEKLLQLLEAARKVDLDKIRIPISIMRFIKLKLGDVFLFLIAHNYRHVLQAERALKISGVGQKEIPSFNVGRLATAN
jgi:hypothetical protein